jgi:hypothetical protein
VILPPLVFPDETFPFRSLDMTCNIGLRGCIHNTSFSSLLTNGSISLSICPWQAFEV